MSFLIKLKNKVASYEFVKEAPSSFDAWFYAVDTYGLYFNSITIKRIA